MKCIIKQPCGLGDILFTSKIRKLLEEKGHEVIHPVIKEFNWIGDYIEGIFPTYDETFSYYKLVDNFRGLYPTEIKHSNEKIIIIPLQTADMLYSGSVMDAKYKLVNLSYNNWSSFYTIKRNQEKENELYYDILKLQDNEKYIVTCCNYGSPPNFNTRNLSINTPYRIINISFINGITFFDWIKVLENAQEIHAIESSINYILEKININPKNVFIYSKHLPPNFNAVKHLFSKNWNYIYK